MPRRTGPKDVCYYCSKKFWAQSLLGGKYVCSFCYQNDAEFLYEKDHFHDALTIQTIWRLHKGITPKYLALYLSNKGSDKRDRYKIPASLIHELLSLAILNAAV